MKNISIAPKSLVPLSQSLSDLSPQHHYSTFLSSSFVFSRCSVSGCLTNLAQLPRFISAVICASSPMKVSKIILGVI